MWDVRLSSTRKLFEAPHSADRYQGMTARDIASPVLDENFLQDLLDRTRSAGATDAEARADVQHALLVDVRDGALQNVQRSEGAGLQLTAYVGKRRASAGTNHFS